MIRDISLCLKLMSLFLSENRRLGNIQIKYLKGIGFVFGYQLRLSIDDRGNRK